ncbi:MAG TPA: T9SS type A sorting domain-containing protein [Bacteroidia bacterium]|nr:T9SS type A sorting domain-containing protein [Bacteroidia bacterium]
MKKTLLSFIVLSVVFLLDPQKILAQCPNDNTLAAGDLTPPGVTLSTTQNYAFGSYVLANVVAGANYTVSACSNSSFDTQLTVYDNSTGTLIAYNDDFCGLRSQLSFTPTSCGQVRVLLDLYYCSASTSSADVTMTMNTPGTNQPSLVSATDQSACNGNTTTIGISGNGSGGVPPYVYDWSPPLNLSSTTTPQTTATVTATQAYTLTLTDANGCMAKDTVNVTVLPAPVVNLGADTAICGGPYTLNAGNPGSSYLWSTGAGTQTLVVTSSGNYAVNVQNANGCSAGDNINVVVNPNPVFSLGPDTTSCSNPVTINGPGGYSGYLWTTGATTQSEAFTFSATYGLTVTDANGCNGTDSIMVTLSPAPVVNLGPDTTQCGGTVTLNAGNPGSIYFWSNNTSSQTTTVSSSGTYYVQVITPQGCSNSDTAVVTINNLPVVNLGADTAICGTSVTLDAGNPGSAYTWSNSATTQAVTVGAGTYDVTVTDPSGCSDADTITVTTNPAPPVSAGPDQAICPTQAATLTATGAIAYQWSTGAMTASTTVSPGVTTAYYVTGVDANGCSASDVVLVSLMPASNAQFTDVVSGATATFTNQSTNAVTYSWNFGDATPLNNTANPSHTYTANGTYTVTLTVSGPCGTDTYTQVVVITQVGIQDPDLASSLSLYPNPNDGNFTLSFDFTKQKDVTIQVLDVTGRIVYSEEDHNISSYNKQLGLAGAGSGIYFVRIITDEGVTTQKIVIQR